VKIFTIPGTQQNLRRQPISISRRVWRTNHLQPSLARWEFSVSCNVALGEPNTYERQLYTNGGHLTGPDGVRWGEVGANFLGGAVAGTIAVATGGTSLVANAFIGDVVAGGTANVVGGIVTRAAEGQSVNEVLSGSELSQDAVTGFVGGDVGHVAGEFVHVPDEPVHNGRASVGAIRRDDAKFSKYRGALTNQITRATIGASTTTHTMNGGFSLWKWLFFAPPPPTPKPVIACTSASDSQGNSTGTHCE